ncbi:hypothetical protein [Marininema halotolerans]|uniref:Uncharacterized protein n=1 Tax=Marininema halotolerans TaxID=1155944 RepID=A0A1I6Q2J0_9BACL|nr:hypothetical protein [Marininema halotolerans]SFS46528.1 hypothetical protein SAMN05444972_102286 [Marininema halotolerans]
MKMNPSPLQRKPSKNRVTVLGLVGGLVLTGFTSPQIAQAPRYEMDLLSSQSPSSEEVTANLIKTKIRLSSEDKPTHEDKKVERPSPVTSNPPKVESSAPHLNTKKEPVTTSRFEITSVESPTTVDDREQEPTKKSTSSEKDSTHQKKAQPRTEHHRSEQEKPKEKPKNNEKKPPNSHDSGQSETPDQQPQQEPHAENPDQSQQLPFDGVNGDSSNFEGSLYDRLTQLESIKQTPTT